MKFSAAKLSVSSAVALALFSAAPLASAAPLPTVSALSYSGSGCSPGTALGTLEANGHYGIFFEAFEAVVAPGKTDADQDCAFAVKAKPAPGWAMRIGHVKGNGTYALGEHSSGRVSSTYSLTGPSIPQGPLNPPDAPNEWSWDIPSGEDQFNVDWGTDDDNAWWSGCGEAVTLSGTFKLHAERAAGANENAEVVLENGVLDTDQRQSLVWEWSYRQCGTAGDWQTNYLTQDGNRVQASAHFDGRTGTQGDTGVYHTDAGDGRFSRVFFRDGHVVGRWEMQGVVGWFDWAVADDGRFDGQWGYGPDGSPAVQRWSGHRL